MHGHLVRLELDLELPNCLFHALYHGRDRLPVRVCLRCMLLFWRGRCILLPVRVQGSFARGDRHNVHHARTAVEVDEVDCPGG